MGMAPESSASINDNLHYECNVVHYNDVTPVNLERRIIDGCYSDGDLHRCYFGEILATYGDGEALAKVSS